MTTARDVDFFDPETNECPYTAYDYLRDEAPVYYDARTEMYVVTRYEDVRAILTDTDRFTVGNRLPNPKWPLMLQVYEREGSLLPGPSLGGLDNPEHKHLRNIYQHAFAPSQIAKLESSMVELAHAMIDRFAQRGTCEFIQEFAVPFPLHIIGRLMGIESEAELAQIKIWTDAWINRRGFMLTDGQVIAATEEEVRAQRYFQPIIDRLRAEPQQPDDGLLWLIVNTEVPEWDRKLNDNELQTACLHEMFVAGSETTTSVFGHAVERLVEAPDLMARVRAEPALVPALVEETLRHESPTQGLFRRCNEDVEIGGSVVPAGAMVNIRYGAANRDERQFACPADFDVDRPNVTRHLGFGFGTHACMGAPLARLELRVGLRAILDRCDELWFVDGANDFRHNPSYVIRSLRELHLGFHSPKRPGVPT